MIIYCPLCGERLGMETAPAEGQHVLCPYCNGKFSYGQPVNVSRGLDVHKTSKIPQKLKKMRTAHGSHVNLWDIIRAVSMVAILISVLVFLVLQYFNYDKARREEAERQRKIALEQQAKKEAARKVEEELWRIDQAKRRREIEEQREQRRRRREERVKQIASTSSGVENKRIEPVQNPVVIDKPATEDEAHEPEPLPVEDGANSDLVNGWIWRCSVDNGEVSVIGGKKSPVNRSTSSDDSVVIPSQLGGMPVVAIGDGAFAEREDITTVTIPEGVRRIGDKAFRGCSELQTVTFPSSLREIGDEAFKDCPHLDGVKIPERISRLGREAFWAPIGFSAMQVVSLSPKTGTISLGANVFSDSTKVKIGDGGFFWKKSGTGQVVSDPFHHNDEITVSPYGGAKPSADANMPQSDDSTLGEFNSRNDAKKYFKSLLEGKTIGEHIIAPGSGKKVVWYVPYWDAPGWVVYSSNTLGTVIPYPASDFCIFKEFKYKTQESSRWLDGKVVIVRIDIRSRAEINERIIKNAQKQLVESGAQGTDENGRKCKMPSLLSTIKRRFYAKRYDWFHLDKGVAFILYECDGSRDNPTVTCLSRDQKPLDSYQPTGLRDSAD